MYDAIARISILFVLGFLAAHILEAITWLAGSLGAGTYHVSVAFRTVGVVCSYVVLRNVVRGMFERGWRSLGELG